MLNRPAKLLLVLTTLAPVSVVYGVSRLAEDRMTGLIAISVAALLTSLCALVLAYVRRHGERRTLELSRSKNVDRDVLAFLITYLLPLVSRGESHRDTITLVSVIVLIGIVLYRSDMLHVNPLLGLLGYHFREVIATSGNTYLLLTRKDSEHDARPLTAVRITPTLWLEV